MTPRRDWALVPVAAAAALAPSGIARSELPARFPAAGEPLRALVVRTEPNPTARVVRRLPRFRRDAQFQVVLALSSRRSRDGARWYRLSLPGRPNGARGWVRADVVEVRPVRHRIVIHVAARLLEVRRLADRKTVLRASVAVGRPGAETPRGRNFYVRSAFAPTDPFYGAFAFETSAYSQLTDWPDNGVVGIHGTNRPDLLGQAVSHGCIRVRNDVALRLRRLAPLGTPIDILE